VAADMLITRSEGMIEAEVDGDLVGLNVATGTCFGFNLTAKRVWRLLEQPKRLSELTAALTAEFDVDEAECATQVAELVEQFRGEGLVTVEASGQA
jgi:hypothetical protein